MRERIEFESFITSVVEDKSRKITYFTTGNTFGDKMVEVKNIITGTTTLYVFREDNSFKYKV